VDEKQQKAVELLNVALCYIYVNYIQSRASTKKVIGNGSGTQNHAGININIATVTPSEIIKYNQYLALERFTSDIK